MHCHTSLHWKEMQLSYCKLCGNPTDFPLALGRPFWLYPSAADTFKPVIQNGGFFLFVSSLDITT